MYKAIMFYLFYFLVTHLTFYPFFSLKMLPKIRSLHTFQYHNTMIIIKWYSSVPLQISYNPVR